jgi:hypothetical protein
MFTRTKTKLDRAILLSLAAMLACNVVILTQQLTAAPHFAAARSASAQQV